MNLKNILRTRKLNDSVFLRKDKDRNDGTYRGVAGTQVFESYGKKYVEFHDVLFDYDDLEAYLKNQFVEHYDDLSDQDFEDFANMDAISALYSVEPSNDDYFEDDDYYGEDLVEEDELVGVVDSSEKVSDAEYNYAKDGNYSHYAVWKDKNLIINGWDYHGYDGDELRNDKRYYFFNDLENNCEDIDLKRVTILTEKGCMNRGIDPFNNDNWSNEYPFKE